MVKRNIIIALSVILAVTLTGSLFGQEKNRKRKITPPVNSIASPRDMASGQPTGKRQYKPIGKTKQVGGDVHPGQDGMGGTGMVKNQSQNSTSKSARKPKPFFRPNPTGDGTTQQLYGDVHPGEGDMGTGMVKEQTPTDTNSRSRRKNTNKANVKKPAGFMDYTDDDVMPQSNNAKNSEKPNEYIGETEKNLKTNQKQNPSFRPNPTGDGTTEQFRSKRGRKGRIQAQSENENKLGNFEIQSAKPGKPESNYSLGTSNPTGAKENKPTTTRARRKNKP